MLRPRLFEGGFRGVRHISYLATGLVLVLLALVLFLRRDRRVEISPVATPPPVVESQPRTETPVARDTAAAIVPAPAPAPTDTPDPKAPPAPTKSAAVVASMNKLPAPIAPSGGKGPDRFVLRDQSVSAFFTDRGIDLALLCGNPADRSLPSAYALKWGLVGAAPVEPRPANELPTKVNRFVGDKSTWQSDLPTYSQVRYEAVQPGVDLVVDSLPHGLKVTLQVRPGVDMKKVEFRYEGAGDLAVDEAGSQVHVITPLGNVVESQLQVWQDTASGRVVVPARYVKVSQDRYAIELGEYNEALPLTIDPVLSWASFLGGNISNSSGSETGYGIAADGSDNVYVGGVTFSANFITTTGPALSVTSEGFVCKYNSLGALQWSTLLGGNSSDQINGLRIDSSANVYVVGQTFSSDFPVVGGGFQSFYAGGWDAFVAKLNGTTAQLMWSSYLGGSSDDIATALALDTSNNVYVTGYTRSTNFPLAGTPYRTTNAGSGYYDAFVTKINSAGTAKIWSTYIGGAIDDYAYGIAVDTASPPNVYITGYSNKSGTTEYPTLAGYQMAHNGLADAFVTKFDPNGSTLIWSTFVGGTSNDYARGIALESGVVPPSVYITGYTTSVNYPVPGGFDTVQSGLEDVFVTKLQPAGNALAWSTFMGGPGSDRAYAIAVDTSNTVYVCGVASSGFPLYVGGSVIYDSTIAGAEDCFIVRMNNTGTGFYYFTFLGGTGYDNALALAERASWVWTTGSTSSTNYPATVGDITLGGSQDAFVSLNNASGSSVPSSLLWSSYLGGTNGQASNTGKAVAVDSSGNAYIASMSNSIVYPTTAGAYDTSYNGLSTYYDAVITKMNPNGTAPLVWSTYLGGSLGETVKGITVNAAGDVFVTGYTRSTDFPTTSGCYQSSLATVNFDDVFVTKIRADGQALLYSTYLGGNNNDDANSIAVDGSGYAYVVGQTWSPDFPTPGGFDAVFLGGSEAFITKINPTGTGVVWSSYYGGDLGNDLITAVAVDTTGSNVYVTGTTTSPDFYVSPGAFNPAFDTFYGTTPFVAKVAAGVPSVVWATFFGGSSLDNPNCIAVDVNGAVYVGGQTASSDFSVVPGSFRTASSGGYEGFVSKFKPTGAAQEWSTYFGGNSTDAVMALALDSDLNVYITGYTYSTNLPPGLVPIDSTQNGLADAFAARLDASGTTLSWSTYIGGSGYDFGYGIAVSPQAHVYVVGETGSSNPAVPPGTSFPATNGAFSTAKSGSIDAFVVRISNEAPSLPGSLNQYRSDATTPIVTGGATNQTTVVLKGSATDAEGDKYKLQVEVRPISASFTSPSVVTIDNVVFFESVLTATGSTASVSVSGRTPGIQYHWQARSVDSRGVASGWTPFGGNLDNPPAATTDNDFRVDLVLPSISITTPPNSGTYYTNLSTVTLGGPASDDIQVFGVTWQNAGTGGQFFAATWSPNVPPTTGTWSASGISLQPGSNAITVVVTDAAGNTSSAVLNVIRDSTPPTVTIQNPTSNSTYVTNVNPLTGVGPAPSGYRLEGTSSDNIAVTLVEWRFNSGPWTVTSGTVSNWNVGSITLSTGLNTIDVRATDLAGNTSIDTLSVTYDPLPPVLAITNPASSPFYTNQDSVTLTGNATDATTSVTGLSWANTTTGFGAGISPPTSPWSTPAISLNPGSNFINMSATDAAGNNVIVTIQVVKDQAAPTVAISNPASPTVTTNVNNIPLSGSAGDTGGSGLQSITWSNSGTGGGATLPGTASWNAGSIALNAGTNVITVTAKDNANNTTPTQCTVTYDPTPPSILISTNGGANFAQTGATVTLTGTSSDNVLVSSIAWRINGGSYVTSGVTGTTGWTVSNISLATEGVYTIDVRATDSANNTAVATIVVTRDNTLPNVAISSPSANPFYTKNSSLPLNGTASDSTGIQIVEWRNTTTSPTWFPVSSGTTNWTITGITLVGGSNSIEVRATDLAGNQKVTTLTAILDTTDPVVTITSNSGNNFTTNATPIALTGTVTDNNAVIATLEWQNNLGVWTSVTPASPWTLSIPLSAGANSIIVRAFDAAGNFSTDTITVTYDSTPPTLNITSPTAAATYVTGSTLLTPRLEGNASDASGVTLVQWRLVPGAFQATSGSPSAWFFEPINLVAGSNTIEVRATDAGTNTTTKTLTVTVDQTGPTLAISVPSTGSSFSTSASAISFSGTVSDTGGGSVQTVTWSTNGAVAPNPTSGPCSFGGGTWTIAPATIALASGSQIITVTATDSVGNVSTKTITVIRDNAPPTVSITSPANGTVKNTSPVTLTISASDGLTGISSVGWSNAATGGSGGASFVNPNWTASVPLALGSNTISVTAVDGAGNSSAAATVTVILDQTAPAVAITNPSSTGTYNTSANSIPLSGTVTDSGGGTVQSVTWSYSGGGSGTATLGAGTWTIAPSTITPLVAGTRTVTVTATDTANNSTITTLTVNKDNTPPSTSFITASHVRNTTPVSVTISASDNLTGITGVTWTNTTTGATGSAGPSGPNWVASVPLTAGANVITAYATDGAGNNNSATPASITVTLDQTPPAIAITAPSAPPVYYTQADTYNPSGTVSDASGIQSVTWSNSAGGSGSATVGAGWSLAVPITLVAGAQTVTFTATDNALNTAVTSITVIKDKTPPSITITSPTSLNTYTSGNSPKIFGGIASDTGGSGLWKVDWVNSAGGSGTTTGTPDSWSATIALALTPAVNTITFTVYDNAGNTSTDVITVTYDASAPTVNIMTPTTAATLATSTSSVTIGGTASDDTNVSLVRWKNNGGGYTSIFTGPPQSSVTWTTGAITLSPGANIIDIEAQDDFGNIGADTITVFYDSGAPTGLITTNSGLNFTTNVTPLVLAGTANDPAPSSGLASVTWANAATSGGGTATGLASWSSSIPLTPGANVITITVKDGAGNSNVTPIQITVTLDTTPPAIAITNPTSAASYDTGSSSISLGGTVSDNVNVVSVSWSNPGGQAPLSGSVVPSGGSWTIPTINLSAGSQVITVSSLDTAGNTSSTQITVYYDNTNPTVSIATPTAVATYITRTSPLVLGGTASDNRALSAVNWSNPATGDSGTASGTSTWTVAAIPLAAGSNAITVTAVDTLNHSSTPAILTVTYDPTPPAVAITDPTPTPTWDTKLAAVTLQGTMSDNVAVSSVTWTNAANGTSGAATLGAGTWATTTPTISLAAGANLITITATDTAGNTSTDTITVTRDGTVPTISITSPSSNPTYLAGSTPLVIGGTASDDLSVASVTWSNSAGGSGTASGTVLWNASVALQPGLNTITVTATDSAGNTATDSIDVTYDNANPTISITTNGGSNFAVNSSPIALAGNANDPGGSVSSVTWTNSATGGAGNATGTAPWNASVPLAIGPNAIVVTVTDGAGHTATASITVTLDTTVPALSLTAPTSATTFSTSLASIPLGGAVSDNVSVASVGWSNAANTTSGGSTINSGSWASTTSVNLLAGANVITITATDTAGNVSSRVITITRDNLAPTVAIVYPPGPTITNVATLNLAGTASDNVGVQSVSWSNSLGGSGVASGTTSWSAPVPLFVGANVITVTALDTSNNPGTAQVTVTLDSAVPTVTISTNSGANFASNVAPATLAGTATDNTAVASVTWFNSATGGTGPATLAGGWTASVPLTNGLNPITITATDTAGNTATKSITVNFDAVVPAVTITSPTAQPTHVTLANSITLGGSMSDNVGVQSVTWANAANSTSGGTTSGAPGTWTTATPITLVAGQNAITVTVTDTAGNTSTDQITVTQDQVAPTVAFTQPTSGAPFLTNATTLAVAGTAADNVGVASVAWTRTGGASGAATGTTSWGASIPLVAGTQTITVTATDTAGNIGSSSITVTQDTSAPTVTPSGPSSLSTATASVNLSGTAADPGGAVASVKWTNAATGGSGLASGTASWSAAVPLTPGVNVITITVTDSAGNVSTSTITVIHDTQIPTITITTPTSAVSFNSPTTPVTIGGTASDNDGVTQVSWSNSATGATGTASGTDNWSASVPLVEGSNQITVTAVDPVGNSATDTITIFHDPTPPTIAVTGPTSSGAFSTTLNPITISGTASDNLSLTSVTWTNLKTGATGQASGTTLWSASVTLGSGANTITVVATDGIGNTTTDQIIVTYDVVAPVVTVVSPTPPGVSTQTRPITIQGTATDNVGVTTVTWTNGLTGGSGPADFVSPNWSITVPLVPGTNLITIRASDALGNIGTATFSVDYSHELVPPAITIETPSAPPTYTSTDQLLTLGGKASDNVAVTAVSWQNVTTGVYGLAVGTTAWSAQVPLNSGPNILEFTAWDDVGNLAKATITVTYTSPADTTLPTVKITAPSSSGSFDTTVSPLHLECDTFDDVGIVAVRWSNSATYGDGVGGWGSFWYADIPLVAGINVITVIAVDPSGNVSAPDTITVNYSPPSGDPVLPKVTITAPSSGTVDVSIPSVDISGTASDNDKVSAVTYVNTTTGASGSATGTTAWSVTGLSLTTGVNVINAYALDPAGNVGTSTLVVVYTPPAAAKPVAPVIPAGHCGCLGLEILIPMALAAAWHRRRRLRR